MGIQGLLPLLKKATRQTNIKDFKGCTVAIDSYCWLHKGAFACAEKLALGEHTDQYVHYCMKYVNNLLANDIKPIMVFDGCSLPSKRDVEKTRRERRELNRKKAAQFLREGKQAEARDALTKCLDVTPQMALELMNACRNKGVDCIVAPYEADAQLAFLARSGIAQVIITEDSDLLLFGCERVMYKMDFNGNGMLIENRFLNEAIQLGDNYTFEKFVYICILSGCDYLASLPGIGLGKATKLFKLTRQHDMKVVIKKIPTTLKMSNLTVPVDYVEGFFKACNTFKYQLVFDPLKRRIVPLNPYEPGIDPDDLYYAGPPIENEKATQIALGNLDIHNGEMIADFNPDTFVPKYKRAPTADAKKKLHMLSIWDRNYRPRPKISMSDYNKEPNAVQRCSTKGKEVTVSHAIIQKMSKYKRKRSKDLEPVYDKEEFTKMYSDPVSLYLPKKSKLELELEQESDNMAELFTSKPSDKKLVSEHTNKYVSGSEPNTESLADKEEQSEPSAEGTKCSGPVLDDPSQECGHVTPPKASKNIFSVGSSGKAKKERFSLNTTKKDTTEVKSRFFTTKQPLMKTAFFDSLKIGLGEKNIEDRGKVNSEEMKETAQEAVKQTDTQVPDSLSSSVHDNNVVKNTGTERTSPYRSFGFTKLLKMNKFKSKFDIKSSCDNIHSSQASRTQFKPVSVSKPSTSSATCEVESQPVCMSEESHNGNDSDCDKPKFNTLGSDKCSGNTGQSMGKQLLRLETPSLLENDYKSNTVEDDSANTENSPPKKPKVQPTITGKESSSRNKSVTSFFKPASNRFSYPEPMNWDNDSLGNANMSLSQSMSNSSSTSSSAAGSSCSGAILNKLISPPKPTLSSKPKVMSGCRGPGLTKNKGKLKSTEDGQATISKYFSNKFSYKKSAEKIPASRKPLSPSKNNIPSGITPETDMPHRVSCSESGKVQRKLHLSD